MPTAAKLVAALWFALLGWFAAEISKAHLPEGTQFGWYSYITGVIGFSVGWIFLGKRAGDTMRAAYGYGFTATILLLFWALFYFSGEEMMHRAWATRYKGPMQALTGMKTQQYNRLENGADVRLSTLFRVTDALALEMALVPRERMLLVDMILNASEAQLETYKQFMLQQLQYEEDPSKALSSATGVNALMQELSDE